MIADRIQRLLEAEAKSVRIADVRIGLCYTAVLLESGEAGLAYTFREEVRPGCRPIPGERPLAGRGAAETLGYLGSSDPVERALGLATANALTGARGQGNVTEQDALDALTLRADDRVGMVGYFGPLIPRIEGRVDSLVIFERTPGRTAGVLPAERALELLPACTVALITSTALLTQSLDDLLRAAAGCRDVVLLGPSTPLLREAFIGTGVTWLSGLLITHPTAILRVVSEGGGTREFSPYARKVSLQVSRRELGTPNPLRQIPPGRQGPEGLRC